MSHFVQVIILTRTKELILQCLINTEMISHHEESCIISHLSLAVQTIQEKRKRKTFLRGDPLTWFLWKSLCTHGIDSYTQSSVTFWLTFYLQQNRRHMWYKLVVDHCSVLTRISQWVTCQSRVKKGERKTVEKMYAWKVNQKFGKVFLQFRSWSGQSHLDDVGWFCVDDE